MINAFHQKILWLLILILVAAATLLGIYQALPDDKKADFFLQVSSGTINLLLLIVIGGAVSLAFKEIERRREGLHALQSHRSDFLEDFLQAYHKAKTCRRNLSREGLTIKAPVQDGLLDTQVVAYGREMETLNEAQLDFERLFAEVKNVPSAFSDSQQLLAHLGTMESYLREVHREYEHRWLSLQDDPSHTSLEDFRKLADFTGRYRDSRYGKEFCTAKDNILRSVRRDLFPVDVLERLPSNKESQTDRVPRDA